MKEAKDKVNQIKAPEDLAEDATHPDVETVTIKPEKKMVVWVSHTGIPRKISRC